MIPRKVAPALAAGCTMVVKPASATPYSALAMAELAVRVGIPAGVFNVVTGSARRIGNEITSNPLVRKLSFTGSTAVGLQPATQCGPTLKRISMAQKPDLLLFDEPESGVDLENMALVGKTVRYLLDGTPERCCATLRQREKVRSTSGLIITHTGHILEYVNAHRGQVM